MKRSEINRIMQEGLEFLDAMKFKLPPFATWTPKQWKDKGAECREIVEQQLGWDITDFGSGNYLHVGLLLFTLRNGTLEELKKADGKVYAEKILIVRENQITPTHFHFQKMEDIINRGGGGLEIQFWNATEQEQLADTDVHLSTDGVSIMLEAGGKIVLEPGQSVCIKQRQYHKFRAVEGTGTVLVGEVSRVNDDYVDNRFYEPAGRFAEIEEDEPPIFLLYDDYAKYYRYS
jgi:D-lyxose ketol-isomerase